MHDIYANIPNLCWQSMFNDIQLIKPVFNVAAYDSFFAMKQLQLAFGKRDLNPSKETFVLKILEHFIETAIHHKKKYTNSFSNF